MLASVDRRYSCCVCCKIFSFRFNGSHRLRVTPRETLATCPLLGKNRSAMSGLRATSRGSQGHPAQAGGHPSAAGVEYRRREAAQVPIYAAFLYSGAHCPLNRSKSTSRAIFGPEPLPPLTLNSPTPRRVTVGATVYMRWPHLLLMQAAQ